MASSGKNKTQCMKRGRSRHAYLRKQLCRVHALADIDKTFVPELSACLRDNIPDVDDEHRVVVRAEVTVLNRRPDFVMYLPKKALVLVEYKTTSIGSLKIRQEHLDQTSDTFAKFRQCHQLDGDENKTMLLISILLMRTIIARKRKNLSIFFKNRHATLLLVIGSCRGTWVKLTRSGTCGALLIDHDHLDVFVVRTKNK